MGDDSHTAPEQDGASPRHKRGRGRSLGEPTYDPAPGTVPPPGETILEWLELNHHTQRWLAAQVGASPKHINQICHGRASYTAALALRLARVTKVHARFWMHLQADYQLNQAALDDTPYTPYTPGPIQHQGGE